MVYSWKMYSFVFAICLICLISLLMYRKMSRHAKPPIQYIFVYFIRSNSMTRTMVWSTLRRSERRLPHRMITERHRPVWLTHDIFASVKEGWLLWPVLRLISLRFKRSLERKWTERKIFLTELDRQESTFIFFYLRL